MNPENRVASSAANQAEPRSSTASPRDILIAARKLIEHEENWTRGWGDEECRCAVHAIEDASSDNGRLYAEAVYLLADAIGCRRSGLAVGDWNDTHTHAEVLAAFDRAIEAAQ